MFCRLRNATGAAQGSTDDTVRALNEQVMWQMLSAKILTYGKSNLIVIQLISPAWSHQPIILYKVVFMQKSSIFQPHKCQQYNLQKRLHRWSNTLLHGWKQCHSSSFVTRHLTQVGSCKASWPPCVISHSSLYLNAPWTDTYREDVAMFGFHAC